MIKRKANLPAADSGTSRHLIACELVSNRVAISVVLKLEAVVDGGLRGGHGYQTGEKCRVVVQVCVKALRLHNTQRASGLKLAVVSPVCNIPNIQLTSSNQHAFASLVS